MTGNNDLISREDAIQALLTIPTHSGSLKAMMISRIEDLPSVTQSDKMKRKRNNEQGTLSREKVGV